MTCLHCPSTVLKDTVTYGLGAETGIEPVVLAYDTNVLPLDYSAIVGELISPPEEFF